MGGGLLSIEAKAAAAVLGVLGGVGGCPDEPVGVALPPIKAADNMGRPGEAGDGLKSACSGWICLPPGMPGGGGLLLSAMQVKRTCLILELKSRADT